MPRGPRVPSYGTASHFRDYTPDAMVSSEVDRWTLFRVRAGSQLTVNAAAAAAAGLVIEMTGDDCAERHLTNAARTTATPPGELIVNSVNSVVSRRPVRRVDDAMKSLVVGHRVTVCWLTAVRRTSYTQTCKRIIIATTIVFITALL